MSPFADHDESRWDQGSTAVGAFVAVWGSGQMTVMIELSACRAGVPTREPRRGNVIVLLVAGCGREHKMSNAAKAFKSRLVYPEFLVCAVPLIKALDHEGLVFDRDDRSDAICSHQLLLPLCPRQVQVGCPVDVTKAPQRRHNVRKILSVLRSLYQKCMLRVFAVGVDQFLLLASTPQPHRDELV
jgi:hypothetical protein